MHWKIVALTRTGNEVVFNRQGKKEHILADLESEDLAIMTMAPDVAMLLRQFLRAQAVNKPTLSSFFIDFSRMLQSGLSVSETLRTLSGMTSDKTLRAGMESVGRAIHDGDSLRTSFEKAGIFPDIVGASLDAAEKSGQVPEISRILGEYFEYIHDTKKRILGSLLYPGAVFVALTVASVIISIKLLPQLEFLMPEGHSRSVSFVLLLGYGHFMKDYWWTLLVLGGMIFFAFAYVWSIHKDLITKHLFQTPLLGSILKEFEIARIFLNLYIYVKSGIPVTQALTGIQGVNGTFVTNKLLRIRNLIHGGMTMGEGFETDKFFPAYVCQSLKKGEETGKRSEYLYETYRYYDGKSKDSVNRATRLISPVLMSLAFAFAGFIASFYALIYQRMGTMSTGIYQ